VPEVEEAIALFYWLKQLVLTSEHKNMSVILAYGIGLGLPRATYNRKS